MLGWFKKKKKVREDIAPVPDAISAEEGQSSEITESVADIPSATDQSQDYKISKAAETEKVPEQDNQTGLFKRLQDSLSKTRDSLVSRVDDLFLGKKEIDAQLLDELEEIPGKIEKIISNNDYLKKISFRESFFHLCQRLHLKYEVETRW